MICRVFCSEEHCLVSSWAFLMCMQASRVKFEPCIIVMILVTIFATCFTGSEPDDDDDGKSGCSHRLALPWLQKI